MTFLKTLGDALYQRVFVAYRSTLIGIACAAGIEVVNSTTAYLQSVPAGWQHAVAGIAVVAGALIKGKLAAKVITPAALLFVLAFAAPAQAQEQPLPASLCAIGSQGNWCFGLLPTITTVGVDVKNGGIVAGVNIGTSLAATYKAGQLTSVSLGLHTSFQANSSSGLPQSASLGGTLSFLKGWATVIVDWQAVGGNHALVIAPALGVPL